MLRMTPRLPIQVLQLEQLPCWKRTQLVKLPCRHHIYDLHSKNAREAILGGQTLGPGHPKWVAQPHWGGISNFLSKPKAVTNARFGEPANYYLTIALLSNQLPWLTPAQSQEVGKATTREGWAVAVRHQDNLRK